MRQFYCKKCKRKILPEYAFKDNEMVILLSCSNKKCKLFELPKTPKDLIVGAKEMTLRQIHDRWDIPITTLRYWIRKGLLKAHQFAPRGKIYIDPIELPSYMRGEK